MASVLTFAGLRIVCPGFGQTTRCLNVAGGAVCVSATLAVINIGVPIRSEIATVARSDVLKFCLRVAAVSNWSATTRDKGRWAAVNSEICKTLNREAR